MGITPKNNGAINIEKSGDKLRPNQTKLTQTTVNY